jgi:PhoPQ-activated pathogenicity-related protein
MRPIPQIRSFLIGSLGVVLAVAGCSPGAPSSAPRSSTPASSSQATALDAYLAVPDTNYSYRLVHTARGAGQTTFILEMTSQAWLTTNEVDRPIWQHWMVLVRPDEVQHPKALLFIGGGANGKPAPQAADGNLVQIALATKSVVAELKNVPNQPLIFAGDKEGRVEDSLIAYTWDKFLRTGDSKWPARLPMTKAAVRALDTVTHFCASQDGGGVTIDGFVVAGGSKRGWTTWTTAAVDKRVIAIVPVVIDVLNIEPSMRHHFGAYGFWAPAIDDYEAFRIMEWTGTPEYHALMKIEEPYEYRHRLTMPKFIVNAAGDQFFLPDSSQFYFDELPGVKYLRYVPNADHSLKGSDAYQTLLAWYQAILTKTALPKLSWTRQPDGSLRALTQDQPLEVKLWQATNPKARDFRLETFGAKWQSSALPESGGGVYEAKVARPAEGWTAFFVEFTFPSGVKQAPFKFTTEVRVVPDVLPHKFVPRGRPL